MAFLRNPVVYVPDLANGRPIVDGKVYALVAGTVPPMHDSAIDPADLLTVTFVNEAGNTVEQPQPLYTSKGGCLFGSYPDAAVQYMITPQEYVYAVYNRIGQLEYSGQTSASDYVETVALAAVDSTVEIAGVEASVVGATIKCQQSIRAFDPDNILDLDVDHTAVLQAAIDASSALGIQVLLHPQQYNYTTLTLKTGMSFLGSGTDKCFIICSSTAGSLDPILWSIKKADDGTRARNIRLENIYFGKSTSSVAAAQDANPNLGGLCLAACENTVTNNVSFGGFGQGGIVLARAAAGVEGLGFANTTQDGNYNTGQGLFFVSCGKYNTVNAALWFKFSANSNKYLGVFGKGMDGAALVGFESANDNCIFGGASESSLGIARLIPAAGLNVRGNIIAGIRAESVTGDAYFLNGGDSCNNNTILGGHHTSVGGLDVNDSAAPNNRIEVMNTYRKPSITSAQDFPPSADVSTNHAAGVQRFNSVRASAAKPFYKITEAYGAGAGSVVEVAYNAETAAISGTVLYSSEVFCNDASSGAKGINAKIQARTSDTVGNVEWYFMCGRNSDGLTDAFRISKTEIEVLGTSKAFIMKSPDGTRYKLTPPNGGGAATWVAV
jgi:hypothetical protein